MKLYVNLGPISESDAVDELKNEQNMKANMPDRGKALEAAPEKIVNGVSVDSEPSARVDGDSAPVEEKPLPEPQADEPAAEDVPAAPETADEPTLEEPVEEAAEDAVQPAKKTRTKKSKNK